MDSGDRLCYYFVADDILGGGAPISLDPHIDGHRRFLDRPPSDRLDGEEQTERARVPQDQRVWYETE